LPIKLDTRSTFSFPFELITESSLIGEGTKERGGINTSALALGATDEQKKGTGTVTGTGTALGRWKRDDIDGNKRDGDEDGTWRKWRMHGKVGVKERKGKQSKGNNL